MFRKLLNLFLPHHSNGFDPHLLRSGAIIGYVIVFLFTNFYVFPNLKIDNGTVFAASLNSDSIIELTNKERQKSGLNSLTKNQKLVNAAIAKGNNMLKYQYWSHYGPNGETPWMFIENAGYKYVYAGENLAKDFLSEKDVVTAWMNSTTHKANILNPTFREIGVAYVSGKLNNKDTIIIVQMFGSDQAGMPTKKESPEKVDRIEEYKPQISAPSDNTYVNKKEISIQGISEKGDTIEVYINGILSGKLPKPDKNFDIKTSVTNESNQIKVRAELTSTGEKTAYSNSVNIYLDTLPPSKDDIIIDTFKDSSNKVIITIQSSDNLSKGFIVQKDKAYELMKYQDYLYTTLDNSDIVNVTVYDLAGNELKFNHEISLSQNKDYPFISGTTTDSGEQGFIQIISASLGHIGTKEQINLIFMVILVAMFMINSIVLFVKGIKSENRSHPGMNFAFVLLIFVGLLSVITK